MKTVKIAVPLEDLSSLDLKFIEKFRQYIRDYRSADTFISAKLPDFSITNGYVLVSLKGVYLEHSVHDDYPDFEED